MNEIFNRVDKVLTTCLPQILQIDWLQFSSEYKPCDDTGVPKFTGVLLHATCAPIVGGNTRAYGFLPRPERSAQMVVSKVEMLLKNLDVRASLELRDPKKNKWGGAIRSSANPEDIFAITGLPEIGDHVFMVELMFGLRLLSYPHLRKLADPVRNAHLRAAMAHVGMSGNQHYELTRQINRIIRDSLRALGWGYRSSSKG